MSLVQISEIIRIFIDKHYGRDSTAVTLLPNMPLVQISEIIRLFIDKHYGCDYHFSPGQLDQILSPLTMIYPYLNEEKYTSYVNTG